MATLGFLIPSSKQVESCDLVLSYIRKHYPTSYCIVLGVKDGPDYYDVCKKYNAEYFQSNKKLDYPKEPYGWRKHEVIDFLEKFYIAFMRSDTTHMMYVEEDTLVLNPITLTDDMEIMGFKTSWPDGSKLPNGFPDKFIEIIKEYSGKTPNVTGYGAGGGVIFKKDTFVENFPKIKKFIEEKLDYIQENIYPTAGWIDCFLTYYYLLCGKDYVYNPLAVIIDNNFEPEKAESWIEIASGYKVLYK